MTWFISVLITVGIILAIFFIIALYVGFINGQKWAEIIVLILAIIAAFTILVIGVHSAIFE